jgi:hypothetical protein
MSTLFMESDHIKVALAGAPSRGLKPDHLLGGKLYTSCGAGWSLITRIATLQQIFIRYCLFCAVRAGALHPELQQMIGQGLRLVPGL